MADRSKIREIHGIGNGRRCSMARVDDDHTVLVTDSDGEVNLWVEGASYAAALTPTQARMIADQLNDAARRVEEEGA